MATECEPLAEPALDTFTGSRFNAVMRLVRRLHLYSGLFMFPWVLLYGVTALLFNHPDLFPDHSSQPIDLSELASTPLGDLRPADQVANDVVAALLADAKSESAAYRLVRPEAANYTRERLFVSARGDGQKHTLIFEMDGGGGRVRSQGTASKGPAPAFARKEGVWADRPLPERVKEAVPALLASRGITAEDVTILSAPDLTFLMEADGALWQVTYNPVRGSVTGRPAQAEGGPLTVRSFLTRLHLTRGFPAVFGARWVWAVAVDAMFVAMVFWALSGLFMWWQLKATRRWGTAVLLLSAVTGASLAIGMYRVLAH